MTTLTAKKTLTARRTTTAVVVNATPKATAAMKRFVRSLAMPHEVLDAISRGHDAVNAAAGSLQRMVAIDTVYRDLRELEDAAAAMAIVKEIWLRLTPKTGLVNVEVDAATAA